MSAAEATRPVYWNISHIWVMYVLLVPTITIGLYGIYRRLRRWRQGRPAMRFDRLPQRFALLAKHALGHRRTLSQGYAGTFHLLIFTAALILTLATLVVMVHHDLGLTIMTGAFYLYFQSLVVDLFGLLLLVGLGLAAVRRWHGRPSHLVYTDEASLILVVLFVITLTGFLLEGWRIAVTDDPWGLYSPVGYAVARLSESWLPVGVLKTAHLGVWWFHLVVVFAFLAWAPYTKMVHVLTSSLNIFTANLDGIPKSLKRIDFESEETLGVATLTDFTWKDLLDLDACTECGRCTAQCPAHGVGKSLSPRDVILDLRRLLHARPGRGSESAPIVDPQTAVSPESLWQCTTCAACMEACPVFVEPMPKIVDARRYLAMEEGDLPSTLQEALTSLEQRGHPFRGTRFSRLDWTAGLEVPVLGELDPGVRTDVLLWVGCGGALVERNQKVVRALAQLLTRAGVRFAVLGREESCNGDPARRAGNEYLFESLAQGVIATLDRYGVKEIVTPCPHCFHTFRNDYPDLGGHYQVLHHTELLTRLVAQGKLAPENLSDHKVTFHDPCYLGRHNRVFDDPRRLLDLTTRPKRLEMEKNRSESFCCGGGGGMCFVDEPAHQRVNRERARQALKTGAEVVAVACPFCMTMLEDGVAGSQGQGPDKSQVRVRDVAELLWESVEKTAAT